MEIKEYVTKDMLMGDIVQKYPIAIRALMECGMGCVSCPASAMETVTEAARVHGLNPQDVLDYVNERITYTEAMQEQTALEP